jgi:hypothetical protein
MLDQRKFRPSLVERLGIRWCRIMHDSPMSAHLRALPLPHLRPTAFRSSGPVRRRTQFRIWIRPEQRVARRTA